jgi:hypothetical protein
VTLTLNLTNKVREVWVLQAVVLLVLYY